MQALDPRWLVAVIPEGLLFVRNGRKLEVAFESAAPVRRAVMHTLVTGADPEAIAATSGAERGEAEEMIARLRDHGALVEEPPMTVPSEQMLVSAIAAARRGIQPERLAFAGEELLVLPLAAGERAVRLALRAFVAGMTPHARMRAYCGVAAHGERDVVGDAPPPRLVAHGPALAEELDPAAAHVIALADGAVRVVASATNEPGAHRPHRLGAIANVELVEERTPPGLGLYLATARFAHANLRHPGRGHGWATSVAASPEDARMIARAEAAERYACADLLPERLRRAAASELENVVPPPALLAYNRRQIEGPHQEQAYDEHRRYLWTEAETQHGERRWVTASNVWMPFTDPEGPALPPTTSSGMAVHMSVGEARRHALMELIEREAFMWTWVQRVSRERIARGSLPAALRRRLEAVEAAGARVELVNLTLDTKPVILCAVLRDGDHGLGASCDDDPERAAESALREAAAILWRQIKDPSPPPEAAAVRTVIDHIRYHERPDAAATREFLLASDDEVPLAAVKGSPAPVEEAVRAIGEPLFVDLTSDAISPFRAVRAIVPGLVPMTFGFDREPLGMPRLAEPKRTVDGRVLGQTLDLANAGPIVPHPFP